MWGVLQVYSGVGRAAGCGGSTTSDQTSGEAGSRRRRRSWSSAYTPLLATGRLHKFFQPSVPNGEFGLLISSLLNFPPNYLTNFCRYLITWLYSTDESWFSFSITNKNLCTPTLVCSIVIRWNSMLHYCALNLAMLAWLQIATMLHAYPHHLLQNFLPDSFPSICLWHGLVSLVCS
jgi:hypothetical protein